MAKYSLAVATLILCLVVPIFAGFIMPDNAQEDTWRTEITPLDITDSLMDAAVPNTVPYNGANNNMFLYDANNGTYIMKGNTETNNVTVYDRSTYLGGGVPNPNDDMPAGAHTVSVSTIWNHWKSYAEANSDTADLLKSLVWCSAGGSLTFTHHNTAYTALHIFKNGRAILLDPNQGLMADVTDQDITYTRSNWTVLQLLGEPYNTPAFNNPLYYDPADGFHWEYDSSNAVWMNGYMNHSIRMIIKSPDTGGDLIAIRIGSELMGVYNYDNMLLVYAYDEEGDTVMEALGNVGAYSYLLIYADSDTKTLQVSGLMGLESFTSSYTDRIGNTVTMQFLSDPFTSMNFEVGEIDYYVTSTRIESGTTMAIQDKTFNPTSYKGKDEWQVWIANPVQFGSTIGFDSIEYTVENGYVTLPLWDEEQKKFTGQKVAIRDMKITRTIQNNLVKCTINGVEINGAFTTIKLGGTWLTNVFVYSGEWTEKTNYFFTPGAFNLDQTGYCTVGMIISVLCFIMSALFRQPGWSDEISMAIAAICAVVYFTLMM